MKDDSTNVLAKLLLNLSNYLLSATILCYVSGFAITNLYLGSLGIVNLDILRSRYILTGILFIIFAGAILYLLYGLQKVIKENKGKSQFEILQKGVGFSLQNIIIIYVAVPVVAIFAGSANRISPILPQTNPDISWNQWLNTEPIKYIPTTIFVLFSIIAFVTAFLLLVVIIILILNPKDKDGVSTTRKEKIREFFMAITDKINYKKIFVGLIIGFLGLYAVVLLSSIMELLRTGDVTSNITRESYFQVGWSRFFTAIVIVYAFIAILLSIMSSITNRAAGDVKEVNEHKTPKGIVSAYFSEIYVFTPTIAIIVSVYAFGVYPYLPQQIGGGRLIPVEITSSSEDIGAIFATPTNEAYLIDRAPNNSLFLIVDQPTAKYKIIEVSNDLIESIVFYESP